MHRRHRNRCIIAVTLVAAALLLTRGPRALGRPVAAADGVQYRLVTAGVALASWGDAWTRILRDPGTFTRLERDLASARAETVALTAALAARDAVDAERAAIAALGVHVSRTSGRVVATGGTTTITIATIAPVAVGDPVLAQGALLGVVIAAGSSRATVGLLGHPFVRIAVRPAASSGTIGIVESRGDGGLVVTHIPRSAALPDGTPIVTSAATATIPDRVPIGTLHNLHDEPGGFFRVATVEPIASPERTTVVTVLRARER